MSEYISESYMEWLLFAKDDQEHTKLMKNNTSYKWGHNHYVGKYNKSIREEA